MTSLLAILKESWLSLRAERLFRVVMGLNILVIVAYASMGFPDTGFTLFYGLFEEESEYINTHSPLAKTLYLGIYSAFIVNIWLAWAASILALISTSSIFPKFLSEGSVELVLSRPIRRTTVFAIKYVSGLIFVMLQVTVFTVGAFFAAGWRIDVWDPAIFLAIPLLTLFYSYLFCVNVFVGVLTRSTLVALLATLLFWFGTFGIRTADDQIQRFWLMSETTADESTQRLFELTAEIEQAWLEDQTKVVRELRVERRETETDLANADEAIERLNPWKSAIGFLRMGLPETARTLGLLHRELERGSDNTLMDLMSGRAFEEDSDYPQNEFQKRRMDAEEKSYERELSIPGWKIIGKSLIFEFVILTCAIWIFRRRDY